MLWHRNVFKARHALHQAQGTPQVNAYATLAWQCTTDTALNALLEPFGTPRHQSACSSADKEPFTVKFSKLANVKQVMASIMMFAQLALQISSLRTITVYNVRPILYTTKFQQSANALLGMSSTGKGSVILNVQMGRCTIRLQESVNAWRDLVELWPVDNARFVLRVLFQIQRPNCVKTAKLTNKMLMVNVFASRASLQTS